MKKIFLLLLFIPAIAAAQKGITFKIEKLDKPDRLLWLKSTIGLYEDLILSDLNMSKNDIKESSFDFGVITHSQMPDSLVCFSKNPFFYGMYSAYADHRPFVLSPDMVWLLISQGFAQHVKNNAEQLRHLFVDFDEKESLVVTTTKDMLIDSSREEWETIFPQFTKQIGDRVGADLVDILNCNFTTSTLTTTVASQITIMEAMKSYFDFVVIRIVCGIPQITLEGTPEDWQKVLDKAIYLRKYDLAWWIDELIPYLEEFVRASKGDVDKEFWRNMFKYHTPKQYGAPKVIDGWIVKFFPYDKHGKRNDLAKIDKNDILPPEFVKVDIRYIDTSDDKEKEYPLEVWAGFIGLEQNPKTFALKPHIGWMVKKKDIKGVGLQTKFKQDNVAPYSRGISIRVKEIPQELLMLDSINHLEVYFIDKVEIPEKMTLMNIKSFHVHGKVTKAEKEHIRQILPNTTVYFNDDRIGVNFILD